MPSCSYKYRSYLAVPWGSKRRLALNVQHQLQERLAEADRLRRQYVERAQYEAEQTRIRYMRVDPNNRLVADTLEGLWNDKLRQLEQARQEYEKQRESAERTISQQQKDQIVALAEDFPRLWDNPATSISTAIPGASRIGSLRTAIRPTGSFTTARWGT